MSHLYNRSINEEKFSQNQSSSKYKKILFNLCFFHSILVERKIFKNFGWNEVYDFSDSDFEVKHKKYIQLIKKRSHVFRLKWRNLIQNYNHLFYTNILTLTKLY